MSDDFKRLTEDDEAEKEKYWLDYVYEFMKEFSMDLLFMVFIGLQEINDTSYFHSLGMLARFEKKALLIGAIGAHIMSNFAVVIFFWMLFSFMNRQNLKMFGIALMYFIVAYEMVNNVLRSMGMLLELRK